MRPSSILWHLGGVLLMQYLTTLFIASVIDEWTNGWMNGWSVRLQWNDNDRWKSTYSEKNLRFANHKSHTNLALKYARGQRPPADRRSHGTARCRLWNRKSGMLSPILKRKFPPLFQGRKWSKIFILNADTHLPVYTVSWPTRTQYELSPRWKPQIPFANCCPVIYLKFRCGKCNSKFVPRPTI